MANGFTQKQLETILCSPAARNPLVKRLATALSERIAKDEEALSEEIEIIIGTDGLCEVLGSDRVKVKVTQRKKPVPAVVIENQCGACEPMVAKSEPGTLGEQLAAIATYLDDQRRNREKAWKQARKKCLSHLQRTE